MVIFPLAPDQTIAQMWSNGARGGQRFYDQFWKTHHVEVNWHTEISCKNIAYIALCAWS